MRYLPQIFTAFLCGCGGLNQLTQHSSLNRQPCLINLTYERTFVSGIYDLPRYTAREYSDHCSEYLGENIQTLRFRLNVQTKESVGMIEQVSIDGRRLLQAPYGLTATEVVLDNIDTSKTDNGPLQMDFIWVSFAFPMGSEKSLYPSKVELIVTPR